VTAVDSSPAAVAALRRIDSPHVRVVQSSIEGFEPAAYELVNAQYSLPFVAPHKFDSTLDRLLGAVKPGGVMCALFFGPRDEWNRPGAEIVFNTRAEVARLFSGWDVVELNEVEEDGKTADGSAKHWHVIHATARRPG